MPSFRQFEPGVRSLAIPEVALEYIAKTVAEGRADTTTAKAHWLLEQLAPLVGHPLADLKPIDVLAALKRRSDRVSAWRADHAEDHASRSDH